MLTVQEDDTPEDDEDKPVWDDDDLGDYPKTASLRARASGSSLRSGTATSSARTKTPDRSTWTPTLKTSRPLARPRPGATRRRARRARARRRQRTRRPSRPHRRREGCKVKAAMTQYRELDHEDEVGGIKTRFKYTKSAPVSYGLTPAEILMATDEELNALISVKHYAPYRRGGLGLQGRGFGRRLRLKDRVGSRSGATTCRRKSRRRACSFPGGSEHHRTRRALRAQEACREEGAPA
jgi:protein KRI1